LKPAYEPIIIARKPIEKKLTIAKNVLKYGVGTINIDGCRVSAPGEDFSNIKPRQIQKLHSFNHDENSVTYKEAKEKLQNIGRFPANVVLSHHPDCKKVGEAKEKIAKNVSFKDTKQSDAGWGTKKCNTENVELTRDVYECVEDCAVKMLDGQSGITKGSGKRTITQAGIGGGVLGKHDGRKKMPTAKEGLKTVRNLGDSGGASRFFKCVGGGEDLIPGYEPIIIARKPLEKKLTVAKNVLKHGVGAINIDECRVGYENDKADPATNPLYRHQNADKYKQVTDHGQKVGANVPFTNSLNPPKVKGRFPANVILSHHPDCEKVGETEDTFASNDPEAGHYQTGETFVVGVGKNYKQKKSTIVREVYDCADDCPTKILDEQSGIKKAGKELITKHGNQKIGFREAYVNGEENKMEGVVTNYHDGGGASRFFKCVEDCPTKILDEQSGIIKGGKSAPNRKQGFKKSYVGDNIESCKITTSTSYDDTGGASRYFKCVDGCPSKTLDEQSGTKKGSGKQSKGSGSGGIWKSSTGKPAGDTYGDSGGASRFFYHSKVSKKERNLGCGEMDPKDTAAKEFRPNHAVKAEAGEGGNPYGRWKPQKNNHPTVKPIALMRYLIKMYCPPKETVLDPFTGSGSTGMAAMYEGRDFIGIEREEEYLVIAEARIKYAEEDAD